jgi:acyl transferase domain-containing protein/NRPS condensation-like uncharacterized protein
MFSRKKMNKTIDKTTKTRAAYTGMELAVIGMAMKAPGARDYHEFWENLKNGIESIFYFSDRELEEAGVGPHTLNESDYVKANGILEDFDYFDASFFSYTPMEAEIMDPQIRIMHECVWEALEDAGYDPFSYKGMIGLYAGSSSSLYWQSLCYFSGKTEPFGGFAVPHFTDKDFISSRVAYKLNLKGPVYTSHTACSTSLAAVHQACRALLTGDCTMALAGGVCISIPQVCGYQYEDGMINSPDGHCRAFDARAKGVAGGSGAGIAVLKLLDQAIKDRDHIYAVIKASACNNDGNRKVGYTAPSINGQAEVIKKALRMAQVEPESIGCIETHGTATNLGDPVEIEGLKTAYNTKKRNFCAIGSIKSNMGHLDAAAGIAGLLKTVLAIQQGFIPPSLHFEQPNPEIDLETSPFYVNTTLTPWENGNHPRRAGVSSFGIGGTNVHVILEEAPPTGSTPDTAASEQPYRLFLLSAETGPALEQTSTNLAAYVQNNPSANLADISYTLQAGRRALKHRRMAVCAERDQVIEALSSPNSTGVDTFIPEKENSPIIFMFSGQGSQYINMGLELYHGETGLKEEIDRCFDILKQVEGVEMKHILYPALFQPGNSEEAEKKINQFSYTTPIKFIFEYSIAKLLMKWGVKPHAMIGHSFGEYVAACLAGVFSLEDAISVAALRGRLMDQSPEGAMMSVTISQSELSRYLEKDISLAAVNGETYCIVSGPVDTIEAFEEKLSGKGYECARLRVPRAGHSHMLEPIMETFRQKFTAIKLNKPQIPYISCVTGTWVRTEDVTDPSYWSRHLRETVRFGDGLSELLKEENAIFIQVGSDRSLVTFVERHPARKKNNLVLNLIRHPKDTISDHYFLLEKIGMLWLMGISIDWPVFNSPGKPHRIPLPTYPFQRQPFRINGNLLKMDAAALSTKHQTGFRKNPDISDWFYHPTWRRAVLPPTREKNTAPQSHCLVFTRGETFGSRLIKQLEQRGSTVTVVQPASTYEKTGERTYTINPGNPHDYDALFNHLSRVDKKPVHILHMWGVDQIQNPGWEDIPNQELLNSVFYSFIYIAKAIGKHNFIQEIRITAITNGMQEVLGNDPISPGKALVLSPLKVIPQEYSNITCTCIDIDTPQPGSLSEKQLAVRLGVELETVSPDKIIAYREGQRWVPYFQPVRLEKHLEETSVFKNGGVYLVTGGTGKVGLSLVENLVKKIKATFVLTGRTQFPEGKDFDSRISQQGENHPISRKIQKIRQLRETGSKIIVITGDAADKERMQAVVSEVEQEFGKINGVIHAAGVSDAETYQIVNDISKEQCERQFRPKMHGIQVLAEIFRTREPDFLLAVSSLAAILGGLAHIAYTAANLYMDAFITAHNRVNHTPWISVDSEVWKFVTGESQEARDSTLFAADLEKLSMTPAEGTRALQRILGWGYPGQVIISSCPIEARIDKWVQLASMENREPEVTPTGKEEKKSSFLARPRLNTSYKAPRTRMEQVLVEIWQDFFGIQQIGIEDDFFALGGDSLKGMMLVNRYKKLLDEIVYVTVVFEAPTIMELAAYFEKHYPRAAARVTDKTPGSKTGITAAAISEQKIRRFAELLPKVSIGRDPETLKNPPALFVLSPPRSGSTLLRVMLAGHPGLFSPPELGLLMLNNFAEKEYSRDPVIRTIMQLKQCDAESAKEFLRELETGSMSIKQFYRLIQEWPGNRLLVDKSPIYSFDIEALQRMEAYFDNPRYIHLMRHPYGMIRSWEEAKLDLVHGGDILEKLSLSRKEAAEMEWIIAHRNIMEFLDRIPGNRQLFITFEELVKNPADTMKNICRYLDLEFHPHMLQPYHNKKERMTDGIYREGMMTGDPKFHTHKKIDPQIAETWKKTYTRDFLSPITRKMARRFGYAPIQESIYSTLEAVELKEYYPVSSTQKRLYILQQMNPASTAYNIHEIYEIQADPHRERLRQAFQGLVSRHESLRTAFISVGDEIRQRIYRPRDIRVNIEFHQETGNRAQPGQSLDQAIHGRVKSFDLSTAPLLRVGILENPGSGKQLIMVDLHHIICDGTSIGILIQEFAEIYSGRGLPPLMLQYKDYSQWRRRDETRREIKKQEGYWQKEFSILPPPLELPVDYPRPALQSFEGSAFDFHLGEEETAALNRIAREENATLYMVLTAIYVLFLAKICSREDVVMGTVVAGRRHVALEKTIGMFVNTLAIRFRVPGSGPFREFLHQVKDKILEVFNHQDYPFYDLVEKVVRKTDMSRNPIFDAMFLLQNIDTRAMQMKITEKTDLPGVKLQRYDYRRGTVKFDIFLVAFEHNRQLDMKFLYSTKLFNEKTIQRFSRYISQIVTHITGNKGVPMEDIHITHDLVQAKVNSLDKDFNFDME